jgi:hypothetical protein
LVKGKGKKRFTPPNLTSCENSWKGAMSSHLEGMRNKLKKAPEIAGTATNHGKRQGQPVRVSSNTGKQIICT